MNFNIDHFFGGSIVTLKFLIILLIEITSSHCTKSIWGMDLLVCEIIGGNRFLIV